MCDKSRVEGEARDAGDHQVSESGSMAVTANEISSGTGSTFSQMALFLARFTTSAWVGAASLFVVVSVLEVTRGGFDAATKDTLVALRFPMFYWFGAGLISVGWVGTFFAGNAADLPAVRRRWVLGLLATVLLLMIVDYLWIFQPLRELVTPPGLEKPSSFAQYHEASKKLNLVSLLVCFGAVLLLNWPRRNTVISSTKPLR